MLTSEEKTICIQETKTSEKDTGSSPVQVAILTKRIHMLNDHLKINPKDKHSRRGLEGLIWKRRKHLNYLKENNPTRYQETIKKLGLRR